MTKAEDKPFEKESFRDSISTISKEGKRSWSYPKKPKGRHYKNRTIVSIILLAIMFLLPFIKVNGHPFMLLNVLERKFIIYGIAFWPQDFFLFVLAMLTFVVFIILFTALFGRLWCGWACPQTIFLEMVFRKLEYVIEGDYMQQKALDNSPLTRDKILKKTTKHITFFIISFIIANTFLAYIIGVDELQHIIFDDPANHTAGLISIIVFTGVFYGVFARFREQVCLVVCPYGRLQGVLLDPNSVVIAYDYKRGEPRGKLHKDEKRTIGDCIDCHQCVHVCPTKIDIRNGTQLECVNCTACIDECDTIMERINKPKGLIRYTSENSIIRKEKFKITNRIIGYSIILLILLSTLTSLMILREDVETTILRTPGLLFQKLENNKISNLYNIKIVNKTFHKMNVELKLIEPRGEIKWIGNGIIDVNEDGLSEGEFFLIVPKEEVKKTKTKVIIQIMSDNKIVDNAETSFLGPND